MFSIQCEIVKKMWTLIVLIFCASFNHLMAESPLSDVMAIMEMNPVWPNPFEILANTTFSLCNFLWYFEFFFWLQQAQVAEYYGFIAASHTVPTKDGYRLTLYNIKNSSATPNGEVIFLQHGLVDTAFTWVLNLPHQSLGNNLCSNSKLKHSSVIRYIYFSVYFG